MRITKEDLEGLEVYDGKLPIMSRRYHEETFIAPPGTYYPHDGDSIHINGAPGKDGNPGMAYGIRVASVMAAEKPVLGVADKVMLRHQMTPRAGDPGLAAKKAIKGLCEKRAIMVVPKGLDRFGRLLANIYISGAPGKDFEPRGALSLEHEMTRRKLSNWNPNSEVPSPRITYKEIHTKINVSARRFDRGNDGPSPS